MSAGTYSSLYRSSWNIYNSLRRSGPSCLLLTELLTQVVGSNPSNGSFPRLYPVYSLFNRSMQLNYVFKTRSNYTVLFFISCNSKGIPVIDKKDLYSFNFFFSFWCLPYFLHKIKPWISLATFLDRFGWNLQGLLATGNLEFHILFVRKFSSSYLSF